MSVPGKVGQHLLGPGERTLGIDEPVCLPQWAEVTLEGCGVGEMLIITTMSRNVSSVVRRP
jgi:hypothetical protein